ncbi:MAG: DUF4446 family protein [Selenomonadaceae bacterium]|nr:DUF4446 family protein [Selenomonadaceae bacterium]
MGNSNSVITSDFIIVIVAIVMVLVILGLIINLYSELSAIKTRYKRMTEVAERTGGDIFSDSGAKNSGNVNAYEKLEKKIDRMDLLMQNSISRAAVIHFDAFEQTGQNMSWAVALLDRNNNGIVVSAISGQDFQRTYAKPIEAGRVEDGYKLGQEEEKVLRQAMGKSKS